MSEYLSQIEEAIYDGDEDLVLELGKKALEAGVDPDQIINEGGVKALDRLGEDFNNMVVFLPELMIAGECMQNLIEICKPYMKGEKSAFKGKIVIGTAKGDLHDIGKNLVATQLAMNGYEIIDLGTDVSTNKFIDTATDANADIIAVSSLLTTSQYYMEDLIKRLNQEGKRDKFKVAIGGFRHEKIKRQNSFSNFIYKRYWISMC